MSSSPEPSGGYAMPSVDARNIRPHMIRLGLAVKLAQGAFDAEHVARLEPSMIRHLSSAAEGAARTDVLKATAQPGTEPTMAASAGVTRPGQRAFDSPVRTYDTAAQRSLTAAIQEKMQGESSAAATAGPAWQAGLRDMNASHRGVVARSAEPGAAGRPLFPTKQATGGGLEATMRKTETWRPALRPQKNPPLVPALQPAQDAPVGDRSPKSGSVAQSPPRGGGGGGSVIGGGFAVTGGSSSPMSASAAKLAGLTLPGPISPGAAAAAAAAAAAEGALTVKLRANVGSLEPTATLGPGGPRSVAGGSVVNYDLADSRNPGAALAFSQLDTDTGDWAPKQFRSKAGAQLSHLPLTLVDAAIAQSDKRAARDHDRMLKAALIVPGAASRGSPQQQQQQQAGGARSGGGSEAQYAFAPGPSPTGYSPSTRPSTAVSAAGYMAARGSPARDQRPATVGRPTERFIPGNTTQPFIAPHPEQGPPEGSSPKRRPGTAAPATSPGGASPSFLTSGSAVGLLSRSLASPLQRPSTASASLGSSGGPGSPGPSRKELALLATHALMRSHVAEAVSASKDAQQQRRAAQCEAAAAAAARAREAMLHVQCAV